MNQRTPNRHGKGTREGGRFAPDEKPSAKDTGSLILEDDEVVVDPVADLYDKMTYDDEGYDGHGYNREGFNRSEVHRNGTYYDNDGYDNDGFHKDGKRRRLH